MQFTTGMIPTGLLTIVTGMLEMLVLVRGMDTILKTEAHRKDSMLCLWWR